MTCLGQVGQRESGRELPAELAGQRVAVFDRAVCVVLPPLVVGQVERAERERVAHHQLVALQGADVEDEDVRVHEPGQQDPARAQHPEGFPPDRRELRAEHVRHGVEHHVEALTGEGAQIPHVAEHRLEHQPVPFGHLLVAGQLPRCVIEHGHPCACCGEHRALLAAAGSQAQHRDSVQAGREPVTWHRLVADEDHGPVTVPGPGDHLGPDRPGPLVAGFHLTVPGGAVVRHGIKIISHTSSLGPQPPGLGRQSGHRVLGMGHRPAKESTCRTSP